VRDPFLLQQMGCYRPPTIKLEKLSHDIIEIKWAAWDPELVPGSHQPKMHWSHPPRDEITWIHAWRPFIIVQTKRPRIHPLIICKSLHHHLAQGMTIWSAVDRDYTDQGSTSMRCPKRGVFYEPEMKGNPWTTASRAMSLRSWNILSSLLFWVRQLLT